MDCNMTPILRPFSNPNSNAARFVRFAGAAGFISKGLIYLGCGLLILGSVFSPTPKDAQDESPRGVISVIGTLSPVLGIGLLVVLLVGLCMYALWRFFEAFTGVTAAPGETGVRKFFSRRFAPFISACVYISYAAFCVRLLFSMRSQPVCFPACWRFTVWGRVLLTLLGVAFAAAVVTQVMPAVTASFKGDMRDDRMRRHPDWAKVFSFIGRIGFLGRAALFGSVSALFFTFVLWSEGRESDGKSTVSQALDAFSGSNGGRVLLFLIGLSVSCFGIFAALNAYFKRFLTEPATDVVV
jgi:uncharacterized protein DUF1206